MGISKLVLLSTYLCITRCLALKLKAHLMDDSGIPDISTLHNQPTHTSTTKSVTTLAPTRVPVKTNANTMVTITTLAPAMVPVKIIEPTTIPPVNAKTRVVAMVPFTTPAPAKTPSLTPEYMRHLTPLHTSMINTSSGLLPHVPKRESIPAHKTVDINECDPNPCHHGGTCKVKGNGSTCVCAPHYHGLRCETNIMTGVTVVITGYESPIEKGKHINLTCAINGYQGYGVARYIWTFTPKEGGKSQKTISNTALSTNTGSKTISNTDTYSKRNVTEFDAGIYCCSVMNLGGYLAHSMTVEIIDTDANGPGGKAGLTNEPDLDNNVIIGAIVGVLVCYFIFLGLIGQYVAKRGKMCGCEGCEGLKSQMLQGESKKTHQKTPENTRQETHETPWTTEDDILSVFETRCKF